MMNSKLSDIFVCSKCGYTFTYDIMKNKSLPVNSRLFISRRQYINGNAYCRNCAGKIKQTLSLRQDEAVKYMADSLGIPIKNCKVAGTCEIIRAHHNLLINDPERLSTEFMIKNICGQEGLQKYRSKQKRRYK